jgi:hypothetical protein
VLVVPLLDRRVVGQLELLQLDQAFAPLLLVAAFGDVLLQQRGADLLGADAGSDGDPLSVELGVVRERLALLLGQLGAGLGLVGLVAQQDAAFSELVLGALERRFEVMSPFDRWPGFCPNRPRRYP